MTKINPRSLSKFLSEDYAKFKAVLFYGSNIGRVHDLVDASVENFFKPGSKLIEPNKIILRYPDITRVPATLHDSITSLDFFGSRKVIIVSDVEGKMPALLQKILLEKIEPNVLVIFYGHQIGARDQVRKFFEASSEFACIACYLEEAAGIEAQMLSRIRQAGVQAANEEVIRYVAQNVGGDSQLVASEIDKLISLLRAKPNASLDDVKHMMGGISGDADIDKYIACLIERKFLLAEAEFEKLVSSGTVLHFIIRALSRYFTQVYLAHDLMAEGVAESDVPGKLKPPIFFKAISAFKLALKQYSSDQAVAMLEQLLLLEIKVKTASSTSARTIFAREMLELFVLPHNPVYSGRQSGVM